MKKICIFCLVFLVLVPRLVFAEALNESTDVTNAQIQQNSVNSSHGIDAQTAMLGVGQLVKNVQTAFLYEANSDTLMYALDSDAQMYPASFVKVMTALIAVEKGNVDDVVTVTGSAISSVPGDAVSAKLLEGENLTLKDLVCCMLVGSANDAAAVIAEHISGSQESFVETMNLRAKQMGCVGTNFTNAHGLHNDAQFTTARDAARILNEALDNELFYSIFTTTKHLVPETNMSAARSLVTGNSMMDPGSALYYDARVIGGRTGVANDGRRCFIAAAENNGMRLISVVMGAESVFQEDGYSVVTIGGFKETTELLNAGFNGYRTAEILYAGQILKQCPVTDGTSDVYLGSRVSVSTVLPEEIEPSGLTFRYVSDGFSAPISAGERLADLEIWYGSMCVAKTDLYAMNSVEHLNSVRFVDNKSFVAEPNITVIIVILVICGVFAALLLWKGWHRIKVLTANRRSKRYRRNRRRSK